MAAPLSAEELQKFKVNDLKGLCRVRGLIVGGNKAALVARLLGSNPPGVASTPAKREGSSSNQESAVKKKTKRDPREQTPKARELSLLSGSPHDHSLSSLHQKTEIRPHQRLLPRVSPEAAEHLKELRLPEKPTTSRADAVAATLSAPLVLLADASPGDSNQPFGNGSVVPTLLDEVSVGTAQCNKKVQPSAQINVKRSAPTFKPLSRTVPPPLRRHEQRTFQDTIESDVTYPLDWLDSLLVRFTRLFRVSLPTIPTSGLPSHAQRTVIARLLLHRIWLSLAFPHQLNGPVLDSLPPQIAKVMSPGDRPLTTMSDGLAILIFTDGKEVFVVSETGEVCDSHSSLRPDWQVALDKQAQRMTKPLYQQVEVLDPDTYPHGISRHWAKAASAAQLGVARSFVLCHVSPQGVSGPWQSVLEQQIDSSGDDCWPLNRSLTTNPFVKASSIVSSHTETTEAPSCTSAAKRLALWLPPKFMVEKVGFPQKMHRALAMVQTSESCWIVLWLTGQIIGDEEVGVRDVWQELLQCSAKGIPVML